MKHSIVRLAAIAALTLAAASAQASVDTYRAHGTVENIDSANQKITVAQNSVTELGWPARTMTYQINGQKILNNVKVGQTVDVTFTASNPYQASAHFVTPVSQ